MSQSRGVNMKFVNLDLRASDRDHFNAWKELNKDRLWEVLDRLTDDGYKMQFGYDNKFSCRVANLSCLNEKDDNYGHIMPSRAATVEEAIWIALFKHLEVTKGHWPTGSDISDTWG